ncbi:helicase transcription factor protein [Fusarium langsethiae]|uniref:Helicase transcription factor protein n=1 Tax=Fusarium langsethiae TaxID=179993 RepID=A0A0M9ES21_FUSLA|nr:helicase transcription factor protein [Fusarium langsethiae]
MAKSWKHILNPVDERERHHDQPAPVSHASLANQQSVQMNNVTTAMYFNANESFRMDFSMGSWNDYSGELPRGSEYLGPALSNPLANVPVQQQNYFLTDMILDPQLMDLNMGINLDAANFNFLPVTAEEINSFEIPHVIANSQCLRMTMDSSQEESSVTPDIMSSSQSNSTPETVPEVEDAEEGRQEEEESLFVTDQDETIVHYGMLHNVEVKLVPGDMSSFDDRLKAGDSAYQYFKPTEYQKQVMLCFPEDKKHFGHLSSAAGQALMPLITRPQVDVEPLALKIDLREIIHRANKSADARVKVDINIYGPRSAATSVGEILSNGKLWLQRSIHGKDGTEYDNPHFLSITVADGHNGAVQKEVVASNGPTKKKSREEQLRKMVEDVYNTVDNTRELELVEGGDRVTRQLLRHQKEALGFMLERESGHINDQYRLWKEIVQDGRVQYRHRITKRRRDTRPEEKGGGILADDMGMGKSLSILALVMKTLDNGQEWANLKNAEHKGRKTTRFSRSTLVVVSAALLVDEWMNEVKKHLQSGLKIIKYHGDRRPKDLSQLDMVEDSDIVVTTYHTLTTEYLIGKGKTSPLYKLGWYRVVLDEAHIIRRPSTKFFQACDYLHANSRWCLSGTPIQNKLADIGSLFRFIRAEPFDKASEFRKWIETPFDNSFDDPTLVRDRLVLLLEALCLRRTREVLDLPKTRQFVRHLEFTKPERDQYERTKNIILRNMEHRMGEVEKSSQFGMFQMWLQLRIVCNHGTYQKLFSWHRRNLLEEREAIVGTAGQYGEMLCVGCEQPMPVLGHDWSKKMFEDGCSHVLCTKCIEDSQFSELETSQRRCPVCVRWYQAPPPAGNEDSGDGAPRRKRKRTTATNDDHEHYFNNEGHSTKIRALVEDVRKDLWTTKRHLDKADIPYLQLDGNSPLPQRQETLYKFENGNETPVLIMTTGTGAFGLNLTSANRIFIAELQWNPSVESQAISRAIRLGQKKEVRVTRYITKDTVEEDIKQQQEYKKQIAALGFEEEID